MPSVSVSAVGQQRDGLRTADRPHLVDTEQPRGGQDGRVRQAAELRLRRAGDDQRVHARDLRGHHVHHHAGRVDGVAARHIEADALDGHPTFGDRGAGRQRRRGVGAPLIAVHSAGPLDRHLECGADIGRQPVEGALQLGVRTRTCAGRTPSNDSPNSRAASAPREATASTIGRTFGTTASTSTPPRGSAARSGAALSAARRSMRAMFMGHRPRTGQIVMPRQARAAVRLR